MQLFSNIQYADDAPDKQVLDLYLPDQPTFPLFIYIHGGGLESGDKAWCFPIESLVKRGIAVVSANYRIYPDAHYPEFLEDAAKAVDWSFRNISKYGNCQKIFMGGSSAGAYITLMLCFDKHYLQKYDIDSDSIAGYVMDAGQPTTHFNVLRERGLDTRRIIVDETAPLYYVTGDRNYPPMKILVSDNDIPCRAAQNQLLIEALRHNDCDMSKIEYECLTNTSHCSYINWPIFIDIIDNFIHKYL